MGLPWVYGLFLSLMGGKMGLQKAILEGKLAHILDRFLVKIRLKRKENRIRHNPKKLVRINKSCDL